MSYASLAAASLAAAPLAAPAFPTMQMPAKAIHKAVTLGAQSLCLAATLWLLMAAPGFLTDRTALRTAVPLIANR